MMATAAALVLCGYALLLFASPLRQTLWNAWGAVRRYPVLWKLPGMLGFAHALFHFAVKLRMQMQLPPGSYDALVWARPALADPAIWLHGSPDSIWWLPPSGMRGSMLGAETWLATLEGVAGIFNNMITTFPVALVGMMWLVFNRHSARSLLYSALKKRFGYGALLLMGVVGVCGGCVVLKAVFYFEPSIISGRYFYQWTPVVEWLGFIFEYLFGVGVQIYLILHVYAWMRGISFDADELRDVAIRRIGAGLKWAAVIVLLSSVLINLPLILQNFPIFSGVFVDDQEKVESRLMIARCLLALFLIAACSVQAWLTLHGETLGRALRAHARFIKQHWVSVLWFISVSAVHLFGINLLRAAVLRGLGEETALGVCWSFLWPWLAAPVLAWMLASWVCLFKKEEGRMTKE